MKKLDQLGRIVTGRTPPSTVVDAFGKHIPFVTPSDMNGTRIISTTARNLSAFGQDVVRNAVIPKNAVMVSCIGSDMGKTAIAGTECVTNQQINSIIVDAENSPLFVYYNLSLRKAEIRGFASGSAQPILNKSAFGSLEIELPSLAEQRAIAEILGALDDRIDNLRQTNATLEAIAAALFKSWFVDFDGVGQEDMQESELGLIPKGWRTGVLADLCELNASKWTDKKHPPTVCYIDLSGVSSNRIETENEFEFSNAPSRARLHLREGDTIVGTVRPGNRAFAYIHAPQANLTGSTGFAVMSPKQPHYASFIYLAATRNEAIERLANLADGAAYPAVRPNVVAETPSVIASDEVIAKFSAITKPLLERIEQNSRQAANLASLRDALLPRLISGRLRVGDAMQMARGVA